MSRVIPHLHFCGNCKDAIELYEKAFNAKAASVIHNSEYSPNPNTGDERIAHAVMEICGQTVFLNDRFGNRDKAQNAAVCLVVIFDSSEDLLGCYKTLSRDGEIIDRLEELPYSKLSCQFIDKFGVQWGLMVAGTT